MFAACVVELGESSGIGTGNLSMYITNNYFYFRFVVFVNCHTCREIEQPPGITKERDFP